VGLGLTIFINDQLRDADLASHNTVARYQVTGQDHEFDEAGNTDYLYVWSTACACTLKLQTDNPSRHPRGSIVPVLYDTADPTNARLLVDANSTWGIWGLDGIHFAMGAFGLMIAYFLWHSRAPEGTDSEDLDRKDGGDAQVGRHDSRLDP
jgi:hypothetical protein